MTMGSGGMFGSPGSLAKNPRLAMLLAQQRNSNNGTNTGGLASALRSGLMGYMMGEQQREAQTQQQQQNQAYEAMARGMTPRTTPAITLPPDQQGPVRPEMTEGGGFGGGIEALSGMSDNPYAGRLAAELMMKQQSAMPAGVREYEYAKSQGYQGSYADFKNQAGAADEKFGNSPIWGEDAQGNPVLMQPSNRGGVKMVDLPEGVTPQRGQTSRVDLVDKIGILDANGTLMGYIPKGIGPQREVQGDRVITLPGVPGEQLQPGMPQTSPQGAPQMPSQGPQGAQQPQGGPAIQNLPMSPTEERKAAEAEANKAASQEQRQRYGDVVTQDIDRALGMIGDNELFTTGVGGQALSSIPGTSARDVRGLIDTIRANVGFDRLQQMRDASPTGGALGQVSELENRLLQSTLGNLEQSQSAEQLQYNLQRVKDMYLDIIHGPGNRPAPGGGANPNGAAGGWSIQRVE